MEKIADKLLLTEDVADHLGTSRQWVSELTKNGVLEGPRYKLGESRAYTRDQLPTIKEQFASRPPVGRPPKEDASA